ncbi:MAG: hypothetical protein HEQ27_16790 [Dolichospermum sp. JUN01]|nr:hypothetical protein [Dolichospermum sp. JUN01]MBS9395482.1 hypothetical protein [Dolichospermum sp. OL01]MCO5799108.1 hypothetical protein [Dolichospermum sp. OL03]MCS6283462.1 hypothetical protein [Dolichospermum sp.]QSV60490.1 MAG: hypothetical protein HEQ29_20955 [Dolichospermum sp. LBC05a]
MPSTLLCLIFEVDEKGELNLDNRLNIYEQAVSTLLNKWDNQRDITREQPYKDLTIQEKEKLLSSIALKSLNTGHKFFRLEELTEHIAEYFEKLSITRKDLPVPVDGKAILDSIEDQHGILIERVSTQYCFVYSMFQTYFAAKAIYANSAEWERQISNINIYQKSWREAFLLAAQMMTDASDLLQLVKQKHPTSNIIQPEEIKQFVSDLDKIVKRQHDQLNK